MRREDLPGISSTRQILPMFQVRQTNFRKMNSPVINRKQSVLLALDTKTGNLIEAHELLAMDENMLRSLRRASLEGVRRSRILDKEPRLRCSLCNGPVHISMRRTEFGNRWFAHHGEITECPYRTDRRMSAEEQLAWIYQGQQEGHEHKRLKHFIADWVEIEPDCGPVWRDKVRPSELNCGEWKRPDVWAVIHGRKVVFEIQLSYTFLSEVIRRDAFYRQEGVHILWIFREFEPHREVVRDEMFYNRRNIFVLDASAEAETIKRGRLTLKCYYQTPTLIGDTVSEKWGSRFIHLNQLTYPEPANRPYYRDFDAARFRLLRLRLIRNIMRWSRAKNLRDEEKIRDAFADARVSWRALETAACMKRPQYFSEYLLLSEHLPRLLSIKYGRPIGYRFKTVWPNHHKGVWQVLNAALSMASPSSRPFNILYLMAVRQYTPRLDPEHAQRIKDHGQEIKRSIKAREPRFIRDRMYDGAIALALPELTKSITSEYGVCVEGVSIGPSL